MARAGDLDGFWRCALPFFDLATRLLFRLRVSGSEHVPAVGGALLASNHLSSLDGVVLAVETARRVRRRTRFLVAAEFFANRAYAPLLRGSGQIPLQRGARDLGALAEARATLEAGALAGIYPEGGVAEFPDRGIRPGKSGAARLALAAGVPVVPIGIWGTQVRWPYQGFSFHRPWRPTVALCYGTPIRPEGKVDDVNDLNRCTERIMAGVAEEFARAKALAEAAR